MCGRLLTPDKPWQVLDEIEQRSQGHQAERTHGSENGKDRETVRRSLEAAVILEPIRSEAELHRCQHQGDEDGGGSHPGEVVTEEAAVIAPAAEVWIEGWEAGEATDVVDARESKLSTEEAWVDLVWVVIFD